MGCSSPYPLTLNLALTYPPLLSIFLLLPLRCPCCDRIHLILHCDVPVINHHQALQATESPGLLRSERGWLAVRELLARGAAVYGQLDFVAAALTERARKHDHVPVLAAAIARHAQNELNSTQLVRLLAD